MICLLSLPLWGHVSRTVHCGECQTAFVALDIAGNLLPIHIGNVVGSPLVEDVPAEISQPTLGTIGGHCSIGISGVLQNLVFTLELYIDPL